MRIVLDTNVLVSGLLSPFGPPGEIVRMVSSGALTLCTDARILSEYGEVLQRPKFRFAAADLATLLDALRVQGYAVASVPLPQALPDPGDAPFLEVALAGGANCLVTGNHVHFPVELCLGVPVLSPAELVETWQRLLKDQPDVV
ncbi:MAG: putative toxin-antitoxin system toxin component, PIN family [Actinobacteria bacterium]|nr:putative toxin-antitoxin system toxin component, PIN family [Actinomycetota bacterium]